MKRMTACLMAFCMIAMCVFPVRAAEVKSNLPDSVQNEDADSDREKNGQRTSTDNGTQSDMGNAAGSASPLATSEAGQAQQSASPTPTVKPAEESPVPTGTPSGDNPAPSQAPAGEKPSPTATPAVNSPSPTASPAAGSPTPSAISPSPMASPAGADASPSVSASPSGSPLAGSPSPSVSPEGSNRLSGSGWNDNCAPEHPAGGMEVVLKNTLPVKKTFNIVIKKGDAEVKKESAVLEDNPQKESPDKHITVFENLEAGSYRLEVSAPGFLTFRQDITVNEGEVKTAEIYTGFVDLEGISYTSASNHPGVMLIGDVNGDGAINEDDKNAIIEAISGKGSGGTDLNGDGKTDLVDLQLYANGHTKKIQTESGNEQSRIDTSASLTSAVASDGVKVNVNGDNTVAEGELDKLLSGSNGTVKFKNKDGKPISEDAPVEFGFNLLKGEQAQAGTLVEQIQISTGQGVITEGEIILETDGSADPDIRQIVNGSVVSNTRAVSLDDGGRRDQLTINLGKQVAVKKISVRITGMENGGSLAEITRVEFLNDMEKRIPEPEMNIPKDLFVTNEDKAFTLTWGQEVNVTAYEVEVSHGKDTPEIVRAASNKLEIKSFKKDKLVNGDTYEVRVRSVNGTWKSPFSESKVAVPRVSKEPDPPDNLKAVGRYRSIQMSWKDMKDTDSYNVYYKEAGESAFHKIEGVAQNQYQIKELKDQTKYEVYVTGVNELGESRPSIHSEVQTISINPAQMPDYKLINESNGKGKVSAHIVSVTHGRGKMEGSPLDKDNTSALGVVDKDFGSYYQILDWDDGAEYVAPNKGLLFTLDDYYQMSYITFAEPEDIASYGRVSVYYYDKEHPDGVYAQNVSVLQRPDGKGRNYYLIKLAEPITANKVKLGFARSYNLRDIEISEVNFYHYDSLEDDILALYADDLHASLKEGVTEETINALQKRLDTVDEKSGEYHPERAVLQRELDNARGLLTSDLRDIIQINTKITAAKDGHLGFSGLNAWQPLGVTAYEGEQLVIYVGHNQLKTGSNSALRLIATQYHAEAGAFASQVATLKVGRNEITIPAIQSLACEGGGALYVQYTGNNENERYAVRVSGGAREPILNLYGITDTQKRKELITAYVKELEEHVAAQKDLHKQIHEAAGENNKVNREYDAQNCILGATDIMMDKMMLSVSAERILAGLGSGGTEAKAEQLDKSLQAMEEMMAFFYHHKGLSSDASAPATDRMPAQHLNIRYMRMFAGAFMYASGNHIGIEWGSVSGLSSANPVVSDEKGKYISGNYFGWGIAHEVGHNINQGSYAIAEVTNNYFAQLGKSRDSNDTVRFKYEDVYKKVTSNTIGKPSNVFVHLAMYWQLHLAYDRGYNFKTYDSYQAQHDNLFYARVDSYSRNTGLAPGGLRLGSDSDQNIMRLACAAAGKDLTEFFERWGLAPDGETYSYAGQFPKEERALYYLTDDARVYEMEHGTAGSVKDSEAVGAGSSVQINKKAPNEVEISIQCTADPEVILGYEIARYQYENGKPVRQIVGFSTGTSYKDYVSTINNRVMTYEVTAVDKFGYRSNTRVIGDVRISHDGSHDKSMWTVTTNMTSESDTAGEGTEEDPCEPEPEAAIMRVIDNDYGNSYKGQTAGSDAAILLQMNQVLAVSGLKYTVKSGTPVQAYEISVSTDGHNWTTIKTGVFDSRKDSQTVYFENDQKDPWICTYDAAYVRLKAIGQSSMNVTEIDLLGPAGDSISFGVKEDSAQAAVGILAEAFVYEQGGRERSIPKGSLIFTGSYKGNPAYNVVMIYDEEGSVVGGVDSDNTLKAEQIILANVPENGLLGEVSDGIWIYWIEPVDGQVPDYGGKKVRAQLYRVDNAISNEGQRLVSDTLPLQIPGKESLPPITLKRDEETNDNAPTGR